MINCLKILDKCQVEFSILKQIYDTNYYTAKLGGGKTFGITRICIESLQLETVQFDTLLCNTCITKELFIN